MTDESRCVFQMSPRCSGMDQGLSESLALLCSQGLGQLLGIWILETLQIQLSSSVVPEFWSGLKQPENELEERGRAWVLLSTFRTLLDRLEPFLGWGQSTAFTLLFLRVILTLLCFPDGLEKLGKWQDDGHGSVCGRGPKGLRERSFTIIRALLLFSPSPVLQERVLEFYNRTFSVYMSQEGAAEDPSEVPDDQEGGVCQGCGVPAQLCWCQEALEQLKELSHIL